jgi:rSAM/selenodomain-associated transferase 2
MPAPLSVVIPTLDAAGDLPETLERLIEGIHAGLIRELVISDANSGDATAEIGTAVGAVVIAGPAGRGGQIGRGVAAAQGEWVLILHADTHLEAGWSAIAAAHIGTKPQNAGYFRLAFRATGIAPAIVGGWANVRSRVLGLPYGDQGLLISRDLLAEIGGVPDIPLMEDVALARALRGRMTALAAVAETSAERFLNEGWMRRGTRNLVTLTRYLLGADPNALAKDYQQGS